MYAIRSYYDPMAELRAFFMALETHIWKVPVVLYRKYNESQLEDLQIKAAADLGGLLRITSYNVCYTKLLRC